MLFNQRLNFNQSLLSHSLSKSEENLQHSFIHKKSKSHLHSQLNMTYSRLTQKKSDNIREFQNDVFDQKNYQQKCYNCQNCRYLQEYLVNVLKELQKIEIKFIEKQLILSENYKLLLCNYQNLKKNLIQQRVNIESQKYVFSEIQNLPKLFFKQKQKKKPQQGQLSELKTKLSNTLQSTKGSQRKQLSKKHQTINFSHLTNQKDAIKQNSQSRLFIKSTGSQIQLSYSSSQRSPQNQNNESMYGKMNLNKETNTNSSFYKVKQKKKLDELFSKKDFQLCKLRFQNSNLKSYNQVLLTHVKPKTLASKIFNF